DSREVYQDARTSGSHHGFGGSLLERVRGREVDLAMREEPLGGPGESPGVRHRPRLGLVLRYGERKGRKVTRPPKARRGWGSSALRIQMGGFRYLPGSAASL